MKTSELTKIKTEPARLSNKAIGQTVDFFNKNTDLQYGELSISFIIHAGKIKRVVKSISENSITGKGE